MRRIVGATVAGVLVLLPGCGGSPEVTPPAAERSAVVQEGSEPDAVGAAPTTEAAQTQDAAEKFGSTATWPDGVSLTISKPQPFKPSEHAAGVDGVRKFAVVEVTLSNGSSAPIEASNALLRATSGNGEAGTVFDGDRSTLPTSRVLPGKSLKWRQAFGQPGGDLVVTADWNFQGPVTFSG